MRTSETVKNSVNLDEAMVAGKVFTGTGYIKAKQKKRYWHYTIFQHFESIIMSGEIKLATAGVLPGVKPAVWFSTNHDWEPTVIKALKDFKTGKTTSYSTKNELFYCDMWNDLLDDGALHSFIPIRLEIDPNVVNLRTWNNYNKKSGESREMLKALAKTGKKMGANPKQWFVSYEEVPIENISRFERWNGNEWVELVPADQIKNGLWN